MQIIWADTSSFVVTLN